MKKIKKSGRIIEENIYIEDVILTVMWDDGFIDFERNDTEYNKEHQIPLHSHEYFEFTYNEHSREYIFEDKIMVADEGYLMVIPPSMLHVQRIAKKDPFFKKNHSLMMNIRKSSIKTPTSLYDTLYTILGNIYYEKVPKRVGDILEKFDIGGPESVINNRIKFSLLLHELIALTIESSNVQLPDKKYLQTIDTTESRMYIIETMINENYSDNLTLETISQKINISQRQISRIINKHYGCTFKDVLTTKRINRAKHLLKNTDKKISDISAEVGYNTEKSFYSAFLSKCGLSPSEYRKNFIHKNM